LTDPKEKKPPIKTRAPGRLSTGMFDRVHLPSQGMHPIEEIIAGGSPLPSQTETAQTTAVPQYRSTAVPEQLPELKPLASKPKGLTNTAVPQYRSTTPPDSPIPTERFYKKANEIADAVDRTLTPAESKVFEQLLRLSVGFNRDTCQVRVSVLMERTGYSSDKTVRTALRGLEIKGRIATISSRNSPLGDTYRILSYSGGDSGNYRSTGVPEYRSTAAENTPVLKSKITGQLNTEIKRQVYDDDEVFAGMLALLKQATKEVTGKGTIPADRDRWSEVAELLVTELRIAASRTTVSSAPAFLAEHLRRRLRKTDARQIEREVAEATAGAASQSTQARPELSHEQIEEQAALLAGLMLGGATIAELEEQFAGNFRPAQWHQIRSIALAQHGFSGSQTNSAPRPAGDVSES
jgi:hypothetical protein